MKPLDSTRDTIRSWLRFVARFINWAGKGKINANHVTWASLLLHIPIAISIAGQEYIWAGVMLIAFGLLDTVDGELARLQKKESNYGVFLDASTDRIKEALVYLPLIYVFTNQSMPTEALVSGIALASALSVSYIKAKGESVAHSLKITATERNHMFKSGFARLEIRMTIMVAGLLANNPYPAVAIIALVSAFTAFYRLFVIGLTLKS